MTISVNILSIFRFNHQAEIHAELLPMSLKNLTVGLLQTWMPQIQLVWDVFER